MKVITISREFSSGGRELGKRLADALGYNYFDKEIIDEISKETELDAGYVSRVFENGVSTYTLHFGSSFSALSLVNQNSIDILIAQQKIIKSLAEKGNCVIVGRSADAILSQYNPFNIFVYSDTAHKIERCRAMGGVDQFSDKDLQKKFKQIDAGRKKTHALFASYDWGDKQGYNLMLNTGGYNIKDLIEPTKNLISAYFKDNQ